MKNERYVKKLEKHGQSFADCVCSAEIMAQDLKHDPFIVNNNNYSMH